MTSKTAQLLTIREVAKILGLQEGTIRTWLKQRRLPKVRCGRAIRIPAGAVEDFVRKNTVPARGNR